MKLFIVGKSLGGDRWEFGGVYDSAFFAERACRDASYFVAPADLNEIPPAKRAVWPNLYFPKKAEAI